jgi:hypothetical protein
MNLAFSQCLHCSTSGKWTLRKKYEEFGTCMGVRSDIVVLHTVQYVEWFGVGQEIVTDSHASDCCFYFIHSVCVYGVCVCVCACLF